jgi:Na+:H+ antiporter, NhaA family
MTFHPGQLEGGMRSLLKSFVNKETSGGVLLIMATLLAMLVANSPLRPWYDDLLNLPIEIRVGALEIAKPMLLWINDGLMALFFLLIGLEVKREFLIGHLSSREQMVLPGIAAVGGMLVPALIYVAVNLGDSRALDGWAIPAATDIAFALGVLALLGERVPVALKIFLMALAIMDDLGAIVIIALFYSGDLSTGMLVMAGIFLLVLLVLNRLQVDRLSLYLVVGVALWVCVLKSGVHATLAGVAVALFIPLRARPDGEKLLEQLEHSIHPWATYFILPCFAFANAGVSLTGMGFDAILQPVSLGITLGLVVGKLCGVFGFSLLGIKLGLARLPDRVSFAQLFGVSALCGIGFTMSLFIGGLAFEHSGTNDLLVYRVGILLGSLLAALLGVAILSLTTNPARS